MQTLKIRQFYTSSEKKISSSNNISGGGVVCALRSDIAVCFGVFVKICLIMVATRRSRKINLSLASKRNGKGNLLPDRFKVPDVESKERRKCTAIMGSGSNTDATERKVLAQKQTFCNNIVEKKCKSPVVFKASNGRKAVGRTSGVNKRKPMVEEQESETEESSCDGFQSDESMDESAGGDTESENENEKGEKSGEDLRAFDPSAPKEGMSEYEKQRLENISRNLEMMKSLGLSGGSLGSVIDKTTGEKKDKVVRKKKILPGRDTNSKKVRKAAVKQPRTSRRLRGLGIQHPEGLKTFTDDNESKSESKEKQEDIGEYDPNVLLSLEEYFKDSTEDALKVDGFFRGWVNPVVIEKYGLEESAAAAWEKYGGGKFSYKNPGGGKGATMSSNAKMFAKKMFRKNPNCYFYRNVEPGVKQDVGEWTEEEHSLFLKTAKEFGCGNKWGLFSSYIPHRVGYQCSAYYRHVIIREGLVFDPNFKMTPEGTPVFVGKKFASSRD